MANQYEEALKPLVSKKVPEFAYAMPITGIQMEQFFKRSGLKLTESGNATGINTSSMYGKKNRDEPLKTNISLLLRLYSIFEDYLPRIVPPTPQELIAKIQEADPSLPSYSLGPILGLEPTSGYRITLDGLDRSIQSTRIIAWLIYTLLCDDIKNWETIKNVLMVEALARGVTDPESIFRFGGWNKDADSETDTETKAPRQSSTVKKKPKIKSAGTTAGATSKVSKKPIIRS